MIRIITTLIVVAILFTQNAFASNIGVLYEQIYDPSNKTIPSVTVNGNNSIGNNQTLQLSASATACSSCTPFYYWEANGGIFQGIPNSPNVTWVPPSTNATQPYLITCIVGDGKGNIASSRLTVNVTNTTSSCNSTVTVPALFDPGLWTEMSTIYIPWQTVNNATGYIFQESTSPTFSSFNQYTYDQNTLNATLANRTNGTYYYRVKAQNACGTSGWSNTVDLEVRANQAPYTPSNPSPAHTAINISRTPYLVWNGGDPDGSADYAVELGTDPNAMWFIQGYNSANKYNNSMQISWSLNPSTTYYWRVRSMDDRGAVSVGPTWSFTTSNQSADLVATAIDVVGTIANDQQVTVNVTVQNQGDFMADGGTVNYYYSSFENGKENQFSYAQRGVPQLSPGQTATISTNLRVQGLQAGVSYLVAEVEPFIQVLESDRSNNAISFPITYTDNTPPNIMDLRLVTSTAGTYKTYAKTAFEYSATDDIGLKDADFYYSSDNGNSWTSIVTNFPMMLGGNRYEWTIPGSIPLNNQFMTKLVVRDSSGNASEKIIGPYILIDGSTPSVTFTSPVGGELWPLGSTKNITWNATSPNGIKSVYLTYWFSSNQASSIVQLTGSPGSYSWTLPTASSYASTNAKITIQVTDNNNNYVTVSSNPFVVLDSSAPPPLPWSTQSQVTTVPVIGTQYTSQDEYEPVTTVDKFGNIHLVYYYLENNISAVINNYWPYPFPGTIRTYKLYYMKKTGDSWSAPIVLKTIVNNLDGTGGGSETVIGKLNITADANGNPHVAWQEAIDGRVAKINHMYFNGSTWSTPVDISNSANIGTFTWSNLVAPPEAPTNLMRMASIGDSIYVSGFDYYLRLYKFNRTTNQWSRLADIPTSGWSGINQGDMCASGSMLYAADSGGLFVMYNPSSNSWVQKSNLLQAGAGVRLVSSGTKIYAVGANSTNTLQVYDTATNSWSYLATAPTARGYAAATLLNNKIYVVGGTNSVGNDLDTTEEYDIATNTWKAKSSKDLTKGRMGGAEVLNGKMYVTSRDYAAIQMYDPRTNLWIAMAEMPTRYTNGDFVIADGKFFVLGNDMRVPVAAGFMQGVLTGDDGKIPQYPSSVKMMADNSGSVYLNWTDGGHYEGVDGSSSTPYIGTTSIMSKVFNVLTTSYSETTTITQAGRFQSATDGIVKHIVYQTDAWAYKHISSQDGVNWSSAIDLPKDSLSPAYEPFRIYADKTGNVHFIGNVYGSGKSKIAYMSLLGPGSLDASQVISQSGGDQYYYISAHADNSGAPVVSYARAGQIYLTKLQPNRQWTPALPSVPASQYANYFTAAMDSVNNKLHLTYLAGVAGHNEIFYNVADLSGDFMAPAATLTGPLAGEVVQGGYPVPLSWSASDDKEIASVQLKYTTDGGITFSPIAENLSANGTFYWTTPNMATSSVQVFLVVTDTAAKQTIAKSNAFTLNYVPLYKVDVFKVGTGNGVVSSPTSGFSCGTTCSEYFSENTSLSLTAWPAVGSRFAGWTGACTGTGACNVLVDGNIAVGATFESVSTISITMAGTGSGTVNSSPAGILCTSGSSINCFASFSPASQVDLYASASGNALFSGWSGACTNTSGNCTLTMDSAKTVTATFTAAPKVKVGAKEFSSIQAANNDAATLNNAVIKLLEGTLTENVIFDRSISINLGGGYNAAYESVSTETIIRGKMQLRAGTVRVKNVTVR